MANDASLFSTPLQIKPESLSLLESITLAEFGHLDPLETATTEPDGTLSFWLGDCQELRDSYIDAIQRYVIAIGPLLLAPAELTLREDTGSDERDEFFYAGPNPAALPAYRDDREKHRLLNPILDYKPTAATPDHQFDAIFKLAVGWSPASPIKGNKPRVPVYLPGSNPSAPEFASIDDGYALLTRIEALSSMMTALGLSRVEVHQSKMSDIQFTWGPEKDLANLQLSTATLTVDSGRFWFSAEPKFSDECETVVVYIAAFKGLMADHDPAQALFLSEDPESLKAAVEEYQAEETSTPSPTPTN